VIRRDNTLYVGNDRQKTVLGYEKNTVVKDRVTEVQGSIPAYTELDLRYALRPMPGLTLAISGENLLHARHAEFKPDLLPSEPLQVPRSVHLKAQWVF
jgi:hypothetical protein